MTDAKQLLSNDLLQQIAETANAQNRKPSEVLEEAVRNYLDEQSWHALGNAEERNRVNGLTEEDVPRLVSEARRESERGR